MAAAKPNSLTNMEIVVLAAYLLGGDRNGVDTEDLADKANELGPGRFSWRKYPERINLEIVRVHASNAKNQKNGGFMRGSGSEGWKLTDAGLAWAKRHLKLLNDANLATTRRTKNNRVLRAERARLLASDAFEKHARQLLSEITPREVEVFFRVDPYVSRAKREERVERILKAFQNDPELGTAVKFLAERIRGDNEHQRRESNR